MYFNDKYNQIWVESYHFIFQIIVLECTVDLTGLFTNPTHKSLSSQVLPQKRRSGCAIITFIL